ncbi:hypothetical protein K438DRAFT_1766396 [Mycena galopus ATCC 62051]|nr:hypothetical protein K438DRAFT_1766396 [Mycena galopus ATCC 62051]
MCESGKRETGKQGRVHEQTYMDTDKKLTGGGGEDKGGRKQDKWMECSEGKGAGRGSGEKGKRRERKGMQPEHTIDHQVERGVHHTKTRAPSREIHAGAYVPTRAVQGGSLKKPAERRRIGEAKRVTAAVVDADDVALEQGRPQPLLGPIVESYTSAATLTVEATEKVAVQRRHDEDMYSPSSAAFVSHLNTRGAVLELLVEFKCGAVLLVLLPE